MLEDMQLNPDRLPTYKLIFHILQIVLSFVSWCLEIVVWHDSDSTVTGPSGWAFAVCFLSIPAWIYLVGVPRFPRTRRLAQPYVMVAIDVLFCILWLSAFAAQASYNSTGKCGGKCGASKGIVALDVFICLFFGVTSFFSIYSAKYYQFHGHLPGYEKNITAQNIDPDMAAFSTAPHDEEPYARINNMDPDYDHNDHNDHSDYRSDTGYGGASAVGSSYMGAGGSSVVGGSNVDSSYLGAGNTSYGGGSTAYGGASTVNPFEEDHHGLRPAASDLSLGTSAHSGYAPPTVHDAYDDDRPVRFPDANYERH